MTRPSNSGPGDLDALSSWERQVLAGIEADLAAGDPCLAQEMSSCVRRSTAEWWPLSARCTVLLFVVLVVLVLVGALVPASWRAVLGLITTIVVVPWILLCAIEHARSD
ncbi:DUF3040 domain-containing protein [Pseudonocardia nigra]|uniref:DUF3040 domain-containing protein n=1 Tax=Pseudonocardia nigra TaxID=1921578 RepID=UPI001C601C50|nr:DUF3040 domain-containing protein [Pseudonocardia nigra]